MKFRLYRWKGPRLEVLEDDGWAVLAEKVEDAEWLVERELGAALVGFEDEEYSAAYYVRQVPA
jgi:hypothetical protein